ncbi:MAG: hypothetical protein ACREV0_07175 [Burkholderiales bacterium]
MYQAWLDYSVCAPDKGVLCFAVSADMIVRSAVVIPQGAGESSVVICMSDIMSTLAARLMIGKS